MKDDKMTELDHIKAIQDGIGKIKRHLRSVQKINAENGRDRAANAAMKVHGKVQVLHAEAMDELYANWPEQVSGEISTRGGGGR
ncbi:hypothetical protein PhaeoP48_01221 [Phaeobacter inhibens]|uniref:hypothetical protein n=1 Tax=Phaeobacter inhibens TaxID=221822 RepID=UPI000C9B0006|nr:hypothetical protein [Phaeobacter inhibens]AUR11218.1 hypothetical protein PhaeoP48_01221 [Phaeobacter inhibens]